MDKSNLGKAIDRRAYIVSLAALTSGCTSVIEGQDDSTAPAQSPESGGQNENQTAGNESDKSNESNYETPDNYRFFVDENGEGDFKELQEAFDLMEKGDNIKLAPGEYQGSVESDVTLVGEGANETTAEVVVADSSNNTGKSNNKQINSYDLTLSAEAALNNAKFHSYGVVANTEVTRIKEAIDSEFNETAETTTNAVLTGSVFNSETNINSYYEHNAGASSGGAGDPPYIKEFSEVVGCTFESKVNVSHDIQLNDSFNSSAGPPKPMHVRNSEINDVIELDGMVRIHGSNINRIRISNDVIKKEYKTINLKKRIINSKINDIEFMSNNISLKLTNCTVNPPMKFTENENMSFEIDISRVNGDISIGGNNDLKLTNSAVVNGNKLILTSGTEVITGNHFCGLKNGFYIVGSPSQVTANAFFDGGDIKINGETTVHSDEIGNYYETYNETSSEDGIIRIPREIPGTGGAIDQYPLASSDLDKYISVPESASRC